MCEEFTMKGDYLGAFEELVLLAVAGVGEEAYGITVQERVERDAGRTVSLGAVYAALDRLEDKKFVASWLGDTGAYPRRTPQASLLDHRRPDTAALRDMRRIRERMWRARRSGRPRAGRRMHAMTRLLLRGALWLLSARSPGGRRRRSAGTDREAPGAVPMIRDVLSVLGLLLAARLRTPRARAGSPRDVSFAWRSMRRRPGLQPRGHRDARARDRRQHRDLQSRQRGAPAAGAGPRSEGPRPAEPVLRSLGSRGQFSRTRSIDSSASRTRSWRACSARRACCPTSTPAAGPERVSGAMVSMNYFEVLGVRAHVGRVFTEGDDRRPGGDRVAVLGYGYWQRRFGGDPAVVGRSIRDEYAGR